MNCILLGALLVIVLTVLVVRNPGSSFYIGGFTYVLKNYKLTLHVEKSNGERFILRNLNELEVRLAEITSMFAALEDLSAGEDIHRALENIK
jgi:hypothetical protein